MVTQHPHRIKITAIGTTGIDGDGNPIAGIDEVLHEGICRAEPNGTGETLRGDDGNVINFAFTVYLPKMDVDVVPNSNVEIAIGNKTVKGLVKRHHNGQLNSRLWV